jgi:hypothetical protein
VAHAVAADRDQSATGSVRLLSRMCHLGSVLAVAGFLSRASTPTLYQPTLKPTLRRLFPVMPAHAGIHGFVPISTARRGWRACPSLACSLAHHNGQRAVPMGHAQGLPVIRNKTEVHGGRHMGAWSRRKRVSLERPACVALDRKNSTRSSPAALAGRAAMAENAASSRFWARDRFHLHDRHESTENSEKPAPSLIFGPISVPLRLSDENDGLPAARVPLDCAPRLNCQVPRHATI